MKMRLKLILIFISIIGLMLSGFLFSWNFYFKDYLKTSTIKSFRDLVEVSETAYFAFIEGLKIRTLDWGSDGYIRQATEQILEFQAKGGEKEKKQLTKELSVYLKEKKMIYDPAVIIMDILDKNGIVIVSSREDRLGLNEAKEEEMFGAHRFSDTIKAGFGEVFVASIVFEEDEWPEPMIHLTSRIFSALQTPTQKPAALDAVILIHFANTEKLNGILMGQWQESVGALTGSALFEHYKSAEIYLVNQDRLMITEPHQHLSENGSPHHHALKEKTDTLPVKACFEEQREISEEYANYKGEKVFGASMCLKRDNLVLIIEAKAEEVFKPISQIRKQIILLGIATFLMSALAAMFFTSWFLKNIYKIAAVAKQITAGNLRARVKIESRDEIGYLGRVFNEMSENIEKSQNEIKKREKEVVRANEELKAKIEQLENFKRLTIGRELRMVELKEQMEQLAKEKIYKD